MSPPEGASPADYHFGGLLPLGPPERPFLPHPGIQLNGVLINTQIHFEALLHGTYNVIVVHYWRDAAALRALFPTFALTWKRIHGTEAWEVLEHDYFTNLENHWDTAYRILD